MNKINVAVIGVGKLGREHTRIYHEIPQTNLIGICDIKPSVKKLAHRYHTRFYQEYQTLLAREKIDALSIAVPTSLHYQVAKQALSYGIHILLEKPITSDLKQAEDLLHLARQNNLILQVGQIERFNPVIKKIKTIITHPLFIECQRLGPYSPRVSDIGVVLDLMIHDLDIILQLIDSKPILIDAVGSKILSNYEDIVSARLRFENGTVVNLSASRVSRKRVRSIRIFQPHLYLSLDYLHSTIKKVEKKGEKIISTKIRLTNQQEQLKSEITSFVKDIREQRISQDCQAYKALKLALTITEKIKRGNMDNF